MTEDEEQQLRERVARLEGQIEVLVRSLDRLFDSHMKLTETVLKIAQKDDGRNRE